MISGTRGFDVDAVPNAFSLVCLKFRGDFVVLLDNHMTAMYFPTKY